MYINLSEVCGSTLCRIARRANHPPLVRLTKPELPIQLVRVERSEEPGMFRVRPTLDRLTNKLDAEASPAELWQNVDVEEESRLRQTHRTTEVDGAREADLATLAVVKANDPRRLADRSGHVLAASAACPVRALRKEAVNCLRVDPVA